MRNLWKLTLNSPEMNRSIVFLLYLLKMTKKMNYFLRNLVRRERECFPGSMSIQFLLPMGTLLGEFPAGSLLCGFAFAFDRHARSFTFSCNACSSGWSSRTSVSLLFESITSLFIWSMRNFNPGVSVVFTQRQNSNCNSVFAIHIAGFDFKYGSNFCVPWNPSFWLWCSFSRKSVFTTSPLSLVMKYCPISTTLINPASMQNLLYLPVKAFQFPLHIVALERFVMMGHHSPKELLPWFHSGQLIVRSPYQVALIYREGIRILHTCLRLLRGDWADLQKQ